MKSASANSALVALLNSGTQFFMADLYTITMPGPGGLVLRWANADAPVTYISNTWNVGPYLERTNTKTSVGVDVDSLTLTVRDSAESPVTISGKTIAAYVAAGGFDGARLKLERSFSPDPTTSPVGTVVLFEGRVSSAEGGRDGIEVTVNSDLELLDVQLPRNMYQPGCLNTLYDSACGLNRASFAVSGAATGATNAALNSFAHNLTQATGYFDLGVVTMTSGSNNGISRTVRAHTNAGQLVVLNPWPFAVAPGDTLTIVAGCDKKRNTCISKFSNLSRFRGFPFIPVAETVV